MCSSNTPNFGFESLEIEREGLLIRSPIEQVSRVLAGRRWYWLQDAYDQTIRPGILLVFQLLGYAWTEIQAPAFPEQWVWQAVGQSLSLALDTAAIYYCIQRDEVGCQWWLQGYAQPEIQPMESSDFLKQQQALALTRGIVDKTRSKQQFVRVDHLSTPLMS